MIHYRKIMELADDEMSLRAISTRTGHCRPKVTEILQLAKEKGLNCPLSEKMGDQWIEEFLYPHKVIENFGYSMIDFDQVHKELARPMLPCLCFIMKMRSIIARMVRFHMPIVPFYTLQILCG